MCSNFFYNPKIDCFAIFQLLETEIVVWTFLFYCQHRQQCITFFAFHRCNQLVEKISAENWLMLFSLLILIAKWWFKKIHEQKCFAIKNPISCRTWRYIHDCDFRLSDLFHIEISRQKPNNPNVNSVTLSNTRHTDWVKTNWTNTLCSLFSDPKIFVNLILILSSFDIVATLRIHL